MTTRRRMVYELDEVDKRRSKQERAAMGTPAREENTLTQSRVKVKGDHHTQEQIAEAVRKIHAHAGELAKT